MPPDLAAILQWVKTELIIFCKQYKSVFNLATSPLIKVSDIIPYKSSMGDSAKRTFKQAYAIMALQKIIQDHKEELGTQYYILPPMLTDQLYTGFVDQLKTFSPRSFKGSPVNIGDDNVRAIGNVGGELLSCTMLDQFKGKGQQEIKVQGMAANELLAETVQRIKAKTRNMNTASMRAQVSRELSKGVADKIAGYFEKAIEGKKLKLKQIVVLQTGLMRSEANGSHEEYGDYYNFGICTLYTLFAMYMFENFYRLWLR